MEKILYHEAHDHTEPYYKTFLSKDGDLQTMEMILYPAETLLHLQGKEEPYIAMSVVFGLL